MDSNRSHNKLDALRLFEAIFHRTYDVNCAIIWLVRAWHLIDGVRVFITLYLHFFLEKAQERFDRIYNNKGAPQCR